MNLLNLNYGHILYILLRVDWDIKYKLLETPRLDSLASIHLSFCRNVLINPGLDIIFELADFLFISKIFWQLVEQFSSSVSSLLILRDVLIGTIDVPDLMYH